MSELIEKTESLSMEGIDVVIVNKEDIPEATETPAVVVEGGASKKKKVSCH